MRIALAQINPTVGDIDGNAALIRAALAQARAAGADLLVTPELAILGYPPKDLLLKPAVVEHAVEAVEQLAAGCTDIAAIIGYACPADGAVGRLLYNAAAFCRGGRIERRHVKSLLPTYDVFDEHRYFEPARDPDAHAPIDFLGVKLGISICEDLWNDRDLFPRPRYHDDPIGRIAAAGAQVLINVSASPFVMGKHDFRMRLFQSAAQRHRIPVLYCNQVGGNDELVFDGNSCAVDAAGNTLAHAEDFDPDLLIVDLPAPASTPMRIERPRRGLASAYHALVLGLRDYCRKCGFKSIVLGLSGGIDSALCAALAVAALGPDQVRGVSMPSRFSSAGSTDDARLLAQRLGIAFHTIPIADPHEAFEKLLAPHFADLPRDTTEENVQARVRGVILMAFSNKFGSLLVTTGNKSELAVGYCTLYGDMAGGLAAISDVPKTMVWDLARWINESPESPLRHRFGGPVIPEASITKAPSAELRENQTDQDSLPPYDQLDAVVERYVEREQSARTIVEETGLDAQMVYRVARMIDLNEYKRKQSAPGLKITGRAFGFGRRMPIAHRYNNRPPGNAPAPGSPRE